MLALNKEENVRVLIAYCKICDQTLRIPFNQAESVPHAQQRAQGGLYKHTYIHEDLKNPKKAPHALVLLLDPNYAVRRAEVIPLYTRAQTTVEASTEVFCELCQKELMVPIDEKTFQTSVKTRGYYKQVFLHGQPAHSALVLLDDLKNVLRSEITSVEISANVAGLDQKEYPYSLIESRALPQLSSLFEQLVIVDQRSKIVISFYTSTAPDLPDLLALIDDLMTSPHQVHQLAIKKDQKDYVLVLTEGKDLGILAVNLKGRDQTWLHRLATTLLVETETPNTLGLEIYCRLIHVQPEPPQTAVLTNLLFSSLYSVRFGLQYEQVFEKMFDRLQRRYPHTADLFRPCAFGKKSILEVMNTPIGIRYFNEFLEVIAFVERRFRLNRSRALRK